MKRVALLVSACVSLLGLMAGGPALATGTVAAAGPEATIVGYATPVITAQPGGQLTFANFDLPSHDVVAYKAYGSDTQPWCGGFLPGKCPLFWSELAGTGQTVGVEGLENLVVGRTYEFYCSIHPGMRGTLIAADV